MEDNNAVGNFFILFRLLHSLQLGQRFPVTSTLIITLRFVKSLRSVPDQIITGQFARPRPTSLPNREYLVCEGGDLGRSSCHKIT